MNCKAPQKYFSLLGLKSLVCYKLASRGLFFRRLARLRDKLCSRLRFWSTNVDLNYLYRRQQISLFNADNAACGRSQRAHQSMADAYAALIVVAKNNDRARAW
jgi:hypothetical protein